LIHNAKMAHDQKVDVIAVAKKLATEVLAKNAIATDEKGAFPAESVKALRESRLMGLTVPEALGGLGKGKSEACAVLTILGEQCASTAMIYLMHLSGVDALLTAPATGPFHAGRRNDVLKSVAAGKTLMTLSFSEVGSRSQFWASLTKCDKNGDHFVLNGKKSFATSANNADGYMVSALGSNGKGVNVFYVDRGTKGYQGVGAFNGFGMRGNDSGPMELKDCSVPAKDLLTADGEGFGYMLGILPIFLAGNAAVAVGIMKAVTAATIAHMGKSKFEHLPAGDNKNTGLNDLMNLRARLAEMNITTAVAEAFVEKAAAKADKGEADAFLAAMQSKAHCAEAVIKVTDLAMRTCGGAAFNKTIGLERNFRDSRAMTIMAPTTDHLYEFISKSLLGMPLF